MYSHEHYAYAASAAALVGRAGGLSEGQGASEGGRREQSQKHYMVSGSPCPPISYLDVYFSVSFVVRGQRPHRGR